MDMTDFGKHQDCVNKVLRHFGKVKKVLDSYWCITIFSATLYRSMSCFTMLESLKGRGGNTPTSTLTETFLTSTSFPSWAYRGTEVVLILSESSMISDYFSFMGRCIMPHYLERNSGTFALMSSAAGKAGVPYSGSYTGSKHALHVRDALFSGWKKFLKPIFRIGVFRVSENGENGDRNSGDHVVPRTHVFQPLGRGCHRKSGRGKSSRYRKLQLIPTYKSCFSGVQR